MTTNAPWFKKAGWVFRPVSWQGWAVTVLAAAFCVHIFLLVDSFSHSASDTLYGVFPFIVPTFLLWLWVARNRCGE